MISRKSPTPAFLFAVLSVAATAAYAAPPPESPYAVPQPPFFGQIRTRTEIDRKALGDSSANKTLIGTQLRARLGFVATPSEKVEIKVEVQDVRFMGSETPPAATAANPSTASTGNLKNTDLLQGYVAVQEGPVKVALGRQKMSLGSGRFLSTLEWSPTSRAFDGLSANWTMGAGDLTGLLFLVRDTSTAVLNDHLLLAGLNYNHKFGDNLSGEISAFYDQNKLRSVYSGDTLSRYDLLYIGERLRGQYGVFTFEEEVIRQGGRAVKSDTLKRNSSAFQIALRAGVAFPKLKANLGLDMMSGDSKPTDKTSSMYRANYYFAHMYFGWMDYFVSNPVYGVSDYRADLDVTLWEKESRSISLKAQGHHFVPQNAPAGSRAPYGQEVDGEIHLALYPKSNIVLGGAAFFPGKSASKLPAAKLKAGQNDAPGYFLYIMPMFNF